MSEEFEIQITGLREVQKTLYAYSQQLGDKVIIGALREGAKTIQKAIRNADSSVVPIRTGALRKGFKVSKSRIHNGRMSDSLLGVYLTLRKGKGAPFYGRFINDGWRSRSGRYIEGRGFVQKLFNQHRNTAISNIVRTAEAGAAVLARKVGL